VADTLNSYFIDKVVELVKKNRTKGSGRSLQKVMDCNPNSVYFFPISEEEIVTVVSKLKVRASVGFDEIPDFLAKVCITCIKKTLNFIFNESINQGVFSDLLKTAKIWPVFKKGNRQEISNYRPISVISIFSNIL
jgi:hypothetical protein